MLVAHTSIIERTWLETISNLHRGVSKTNSVLLGTIHSSFTHAFNIQIIQNGEAKLLSVHSRDSRPAPGALICTLEELPHFCTGKPVNLRSSTLECGKLQLLINNYECTDLSIHSTHQVSEYKLTPNWAKTLSNIWKLNASRGSFLAPVKASEYQLLVSKYLNSAALGFKESVKRYLLNTTKEKNSASGKAEINRDICLSRDLANSISNLVGLGVGLTPSGDDYLIGWLSIMHIAQEFDTLPTVLERTLLENLDNTTDVSQHYLKAALSGEFHTDLTQLAIAAKSIIAKDIEQKFQALVSLGSTSGSDSALGIVHAIETLTDLYSFTTM